MKTDLPVTSYVEETSKINPPSRYFTSQTRVSQHTCIPNFKSYGVPQSHMEVDEEAVLNQI